jgi:hypothetical protein
MATGETTTDALVQSLPSVINEARLVREFEGVMAQLVDRHTLGEGMGTTWDEISLSALTAQPITELTKLENPQKYVDSLLTITPTVVGLLIVITDRVAARISKNVFARTGALGQNAIMRKQDQDGLTQLQGATTTIAGTGTTLTSGHLSAGVSRLGGNSNEPALPPYRIVLHPYGIKDIQDEIVQGIGGTGQVAIPEGLTARVFQEGFIGDLFGAGVFRDGNISVTSDSDASGGIFAREGVILIQGRAPRMTAVRDESLGGGATKIYHYDEYAFGERGTGNEWMFQVTHDATAPTS